MYVLCIVFKLFPNIDSYFNYYCYHKNVKNIHFLLLHKEINLKLDVSNKLKDFFCKEMIFRINYT